MSKKSTEIKIWKDDKKRLDNWKKSLGISGPELINKVFTSPKINLQQRMLEESLKREEELRRKLAFYGKKLKK